MKTNIKMRVTPEQSIRVQEICFENNIEWVASGKELQGFNTMIYIDENYMYYFSSIINKEIDADLFIRTNGTCEEDTFNELFEKVSERVNDFQVGSKFQPSDEVIRSVAKVNGLDKLETSHYTMNMLLDSLKKKNEILKKARIKRKNQREELHKLNLKLQKCISLEEHHITTQNLRDTIVSLRDDVINKEIEKLKAVIEYLESKVK